MSREKAIELLKDLVKRRSEVSIDEIEHSLFPVDADCILDQALAELNHYKSVTPEPKCKTINVFDIDMTLEQVLQNVLVNITEQEKIFGSSRYSAYAETYCRAAYEFVRAKPIPDCKQPEPTEFTKVKQGDWIEGVGDILTISQADFINEYGYLLIEKQTIIDRQAAEYKKLKEGNAKLLEDIAKLVDQKEELEKALNG